MNGEFTMVKETLSIGEKPTKKQIAHYVCQKLR